MSAIGQKRTIDDNTKHEHFLIPMLNLTSVLAASVNASRSLSIALTTTSNL